MSDQISQAFGHPLERSFALSGDGPSDRISLRDYLTEVEIGAFQPERGTTQRLRFNVVVEVRQRPGSGVGPADDDVDRILSYDKVTDAIEAELAQDRLNLLETLAERIAARVLTEDLAMRVFVRIEKLDRGPGALGIEIVRARGDAAPLEPAAIARGPAPLILHLSNEAVPSPHLPTWLDQIEASKRPTILTCGAPDLPVPASASPLAQRRIDLLAVEQNAWVLAGRDRRCVVVSTRTELDWAMKQGQISVWAPSKIVLDSHGDGPEAIGGGALSGWFATEMGAAELVVLGGSAAGVPAGARHLSVQPELPL